MSPLPTELVQLVIALVKVSDRRTLHTLLFVSRQFQLIVEPIFYAGVSFLACPDKFLLTKGMRFLHTITAATGGRCGLHVRQLALPARAFKPRFYQPVFRPMLQHLPSLQHLRVDEDGLETIVPTLDLHDLVEFSPTPFSLKCLSWFSYGLSLDAEKFARFIDDQPLLEQLYIPNLHIPSVRGGTQPIKIRRSSLEALSVLHISIGMAPSIFIGKHITHLKIDSSTEVTYSTWQALDADTLRGVVVCVLECIQFECFTTSLAPRMPNLERLQLSPLYVPTVTMLCRSAEMGTTKLRHLRFTDPWRRDGRARNTLSEGVAIAFAAIPSLCCISLDTGYVTDSTSNFFPTYDFFFGTTTPVRLRARDFPPPQWWQDWEEGFYPVTGSEELASTSALSHMSPGQFLMFNPPS